MFKFILHTLFNQRKMHDSTLDLFCNHESAEYADEYAMEIECKAAELEVTVDYYLMEFV
jgi:hypothetical protein